MPVEEVVDRMQDMADQDSLPSNVSEMLEEAAEELKDEDRDLSVRVNAASSILDQVSNDPNIRQHTRTEIWNLASKVEGLE
ncbi:UPF0147 family protein [Candidatus Nanohalobium constans]|uniref:Uncharacterized protein n=1 Tax=Candidatus Nanohalobium constans TaxID=2565781 RepID=A0A5Q0UFR0_9ARCH|nr:UPF0147 family protein [Candidatus Nanohalobium constans]QGA80462.1 hypothetical protein LC1Nh_0565 [Candidatus Nanohalobium constans]